MLTVAVENEDMTSLVGRKTQIGGYGTLCIKRVDGRHDRPNENDRALIQWGHHDGSSSSEYDYDGGVFWLDIRVANAFIVFKPPNFLPGWLQS